MAISLPRVVSAACGRVSLNSPQTGLGDRQQNYVRGIGGQETTVEAYSAVVKAKLGGVELTSHSGDNVYDSPSSFDWSSVFGVAVEGHWRVSGAPFFDLSRYTKFVRELRLSSSIGDNLDCSSPVSTRIPSSWAANICSPPVSNG